MKEEISFNKFRQVSNQLAEELGVSTSNIKFEKFRESDGKFNYMSQGDGVKYYFELDVDNTFYQDKTRVIVDIGDISQRGYNSFYFADTITGAKTLARVVGGALHRFNLKWNHVDLDVEFGDIPIYIIGARDSYVVAPIEAILGSLPLVAGKDLTVYRIRHAESSQDWYRYYSYIFKVPTSRGYFLAAFPWLGSLDSGSFDSILFTDNQIKKIIRRGGKVIIRNMDAEYSDLQLFLLLKNSNSFLDSITPEVEINQFKIPEFDSFGDEFEREWSKFRDEFYRRELRDSLGDIRSLVQDAMTIACKEIQIDISQMKNPDPNKLAGLLINKGVLDGRFQEWTGAFTSFSNLGGHSKTTPTDDELRDITLRKRIVLTILLGVHLIEEIDKAAFPSLVDRIEFSD